MRKKQTSKYEKKVTKKHSIDTNLYRNYFINSQNLYAFSNISYSNSSLYC